MLIYLFLAGILLVQAILENKDQKLYLKISNAKINISMIWIFIDIFFMVSLSVFRDISIGTDYKSYYSIVSGLQKVDFANVADYADKNYIEIGFIFFSKLLLSIWDTPLFVFAIYYLIIISGIVFFAYKCKANPFFSLYLFVTFSMFNQSLNVMRQFLAASIILYALVFLKSEKRYLCVFLMLVAATIHSSAIFGIILFIAYEWKKDLSKICVLIVIVSWLASSVGMPLIRLIVSFTGYEQYLVKELSSESGVGLLMNLMIFCLFLLFRKQFKNNNNYNLWLFASAITLSLNFFISDLGMVGRMMIYTKMIYPVSLQDFITSFDRTRDKKIIFFIIVILFFVYYYVSVSGTCFQTSPYKFIMIN